LRSRVVVSFLQGISGLVIFIILLFQFYLNAA